MSACVLGIAVATVLALGGSAYLRGRSIDPSERFFLEAGRPPSPFEGALAASVQYALFSSEHNDIIFVGDSACWNGVDPIRLRRLSGLQSYNLAIAGLGAQVCPLALKGYLSRHPKPKAVVLCVSPFGLEVDSGPWGDLLQRVITYYGLELDGIAPLTESVPYLMRSGARAFLAHSDYRSMPLADYDEAETYLTQQAQIFVARGFYALPTGAFGLIPPGENGVLIREDWDRGVHEMADTCGAAGVRMLILFAPIEASHKHARDFDRLDRWGRALEKTHAGLTVRRPIILTYEPRLMRDAMHLNSDGVEQFMPVVAQDVRAALAQ